jgi:hypothetical protein
MHNASWVRSRTQQFWGRATYFYPCPKKGAMCRKVMYCGKVAAGSCWLLAAGYWLTAKSNGNTENNTFTTVGTDF